MAKKGELNTFPVCKTAFSGLCLNRVHLEISLSTWKRFFTTRKITPFAHRVDIPLWTT